MEIVGVKISDNSKILYYDTNNLNLKINLTVIVNTDRGLQFATVVQFLNVSDNFDYDKVIRIATKKDYLQYLKNLNDAKIALEKCKELVVKNNLNMTILDANYNFDKSQLLFRFLSDERVDFRQLAKDLGAKLKTRIELRQIGVRDKAKEVGGIGPCGRFLCCSSFLTSFDTISISMAKNQGLALNPTKINGVCGRLLCCLNYENDQYVAAKKDIPDVGKRVVVDGKDGKVISSDPLIGKYKVLVDNEVIEVDNNDSKE
ncbi:MAG: stage 0 sporulation family protein [Bacilli bacterium]